jgi:hypothetical protein
MKQNPSWDASSRPGGPNYWNFGSLSSLSYLNSKVTDVADMWIAWVVTLYSFVGAYHRFGGRYAPPPHPPRPECGGSNHLQDYTVSKSQKNTIPRFSFSTSVRYKT